MLPRKVLRTDLFDAVKDSKSEKKVKRHREKTTPHACSLGPRCLMGPHEGTIRSPWVSRCTPAMKNKRIALGASYIFAINKTSCFQAGSTRERKSAGAFLASYISLWVPMMAPSGLRGFLDAPPRWKNRRITLGASYIFAINKTSCF